MTGTMTNGEIKLKSWEEEQTKVQEFKRLQQKENVKDYYEDNRRQR